jgi:large subunit ribosomal protein L22
MLRYSGIPASKMRQVADLVRGKDVDVALHALQFVTRSAAVPMRKLIQSAAANAREKAVTEDRRFDVDQLFVKSVAVDEGPTLKRWRPRAQGRAFRIRKRTCHVQLVLQEWEEAVEASAQSTAAEAAAGKSSRKRKKAAQESKAAASKEE